MYQISFRKSFLINKAFLKQALFKDTVSTKIKRAKKDFYGSEDYAKHAKKEFYRFKNVTELGIARALFCALSISHVRRLRTKYQDLLSFFNPISLRSFTFYSKPKVIKVNCEITVFSVRIILHEVK